MSFAAFVNLYRFCRVVGTGAGNNRNPALDLIDSNLDNLLMLFERECCRFTGRSTRNNPVDTTGQEKLNVAFQTLNIKAHRRVPFKRGNDCWKDTFKHEIRL